MKIYSIINRFGLLLTGTYLRPTKQVIFLSSDEELPYIKSIFLQVASEDLLHDKSAWPAIGCRVLACYKISLAY